ncbi:MAG: helix-turn-helix domain-containing protein [Anaerolineae bacterium]
MVDSGSFQPVPERLIDDLDALKVYFDPVRLQIMKAVGREARSVGELAAILSVPFTRLYYHINLLEKHGFVRLVETRSMSGAVEEKYYRATAQMYVIDRSLLNVGTPEGEAGLQIMLDAVLEQTKLDITRSAQAGKIDLAKLSPEPTALYARRGVLHLSPEAAREFHERLRALTLDVMQKEQPAEDPGADYYGFTVAFYPSSMDTPPMPPEE